MGVAFGGAYAVALHQNIYDGFALLADPWRLREAEYEAEKVRLEGLKGERERKSIERVTFSSVLTN